MELRWSLGTIGEDGSYVLYDDSFFVCARLSMRTM